MVSSELSQKIKDSYKLENIWLDMINQLHNNMSVPGFQLQDGLLRKNNKIVVGPNGDLKLQLIRWYHSSPEAGDVGRDLTVKRIKQVFLLEMID